MRNSSLLSRRDLEEDSRMSVSTGIKNEIKAAQKLRLPWWGVLCIIVGSVPTYWLFDHFGRLSLALPTLNCIAVLGFMIVLKWKLRRHAWFWIAMAVIAALHALLIWYVPWTTKWVPALAIAAIDSVDFCVILWVLAAVGRLMEGPNAHEG
jgi:hypothetical protein